MLALCVSFEPGSVNVALSDTGVFTGTGDSGSGRLVIVGATLATMSVASAAVLAPPSSSVTVKVTLNDPSSVHVTVGLATFALLRVQTPPPSMPVASTVQ